MTDRDQFWMSHALAQAERGRGRTRTVPLAGAVLVRSQRLVGHAYRRREHGGSVVAQILRRHRHGARGAELYLTSEPSFENGSSGNRVEALVEAGVHRVVVGARDPRPAYQGRGLRQLRRAEIHVTVGVLGPACRALNEAYAFWARWERPMVHLKFAQSVDGCVATRTGASKWITGAPARREGHRLRNTLDGIVVGVGTVLADDPQLTCRLRGGRDPVRIVLDSRGRTPPESQVVQRVRESRAPTWVMVGPRISRARRRALEQAGAEVFACPLAQGRLDLNHVLGTLGAQGLRSVLVEGGPTVAGAFRDASLVDWVHAFIAPMVIGGDAALGSVGALGSGALNEAVQLTEVSVRPLGRDFLLQGRVVR